MNRKLSLLIYSIDFIRYVLVFSIIVFLHRVLCIFPPPPVYVYIQAFDPQINTSAIPNMVYRANF
jgi:hypothetical protein